MNLLHITSQVPGYLSGGDLGIYQFSYAVTHAGYTADYIGPQILDQEIEKWYREKHYIDAPINMIEKAKSASHLYFDRLFANWAKLSIDFNKYAVIYIDFTRMKYFVQSIVESGYKGKIIIRAHNVESDYLRINYSNSRQMINWLRYLVAKRRECYMLRNSDLVLAITSNDKDRICDLYDIDETKIEVFPIGIKKHCSTPKEIQESRMLKGLITGSLWFGPNSEAIIWFLNEVYPIVSSFCKLTVAGRHPNQKLKDVCDLNKIKLIDSPEHIEPYFEEADIFLAPIFDGGGIKVKIAEAMSYGLPVVTTSHGDIGYDLSKEKLGYVADDSKQFAESIKSYFGLGLNEKKSMQNRIINAFNMNYSLEASTERFKRVIYQILG